MKVGKADKTIAYTFTAVHQRKELWDEHTERHKVEPLADNEIDQDWQENVNTGSQCVDSHWEILDMLAEV